MTCYARVVGKVAYFQAGVTAKVLMGHYHWDARYQLDCKLLFLHG